MIYDNIEDMRAAADAYNGNDHSNSGGVTHARTHPDGRAITVLVRLTRPYLGTEVVVHEMHHASTALYGAHVGDRISRAHHLNHHNEPFAYLHSDLTRRLVDRLYALGYYS